MSLRVDSSMINEGGSLRILAGFTLGYYMSGGLSIVSGGSSHTVIISNVELLSRGYKMSMEVSAKFFGGSYLESEVDLLDMSIGSGGMAGG